MASVDDVTGIRYWHALTLKRYAKTSRRDPFANVIRAAIVRVTAAPPVRTDGVALFISRSVLCALRRI